MMKSFFAILLCPLPGLALAQETKNPVFGFSVGTNKAVSVESSKPGITMGADVFYYPLRFAGISFTPNLSLYSYKLPGIRELYEAEQVELPLHGLLRTGKGSVRPLVAGGPNCILDVSGAAKPVTVGWDLSGGLELSSTLFFRTKKEANKFLILPEVRYTQMKDRKVVYFTLHFLG